MKAARYPVAAQQIFTDRSVLSNPRFYWPRPVRIALLAGAELFFSVPRPAKANQRKQEFAHLSARFGRTLLSKNVLSGHTTAG
jgi:hypothetical protein